jgi:undecaprenyl-diphosphatase
MLDLVQTLILAIIQGVTEWLPVSSSGHLAIAQAYLGVKPQVVFDVILHMGTLLVVLIVFRKDLAEIFGALIRFDFKAEEGRLAAFIVVGNIPTAIIGLFFRDVFKSFFYNPLVVGIALLGTGCILFVSRYGRNGKYMGFSKAFLIGVAQGIALIPGVSRSGVTIAAGLLSKLERAEAFKFSFLLYIPTVIGALIFESQDLFNREISWLTIAFGVFVSALTGYFSLKLLRKLLFHEKFHQFAFYCWLLGTAVMIKAMIG